MSGDYYDLVGRAPERRSFVVAEEPFYIDAQKIAATLSSVGWVSSAGRVIDMAKTAAKANARERELVETIQRLKQRIHELNPPPPEHCPMPAAEASD